MCALPAGHDLNDEMRDALMPLVDDLTRILKGKVVLVGVGNPLRGDDGVGPALVARLRGKIKATCLDVGSAPESYTGAIVREHPDTIVLVDAVSLGSQPGAYGVLEASDIAQSGLTTHTLSPALWIEYLKTQTSADIYLLAIQPEDLALGQGLSRTVERALEGIERAMRETLSA
jgi:hydrogenase 3 maturation protease